MTSTGTPRPPVTLELGAMGVSGALLFSAYGLHPWWPAAWLAPIPLLVVAFGAPSRTAWWLGCGAGFIGGLGTFTYYVELTSPAIAVALTLAQALAWGTMVTLTRRVVLGAVHWTRVFAFPVLWAAFDTLVAAISPHGSAGSLAYSQMDALPVIQVAALAGTPGIVFVVTLVGPLVGVEAYRRRRDRPISPCPCSCWSSPSPMASRAWLPPGRRRLCRSGSPSSTCRPRRAAA